MTLPSHFDPIQRYNPVIVNSAIVLIQLTGLVLKSIDYITVSWLTLFLTSGLSVLMMWFLTQLFYQGRTAWPKWDQQFSHLPSIAISSQIIMWFHLAPSLINAIALLWFLARVAVNGRLSIAWTCVYSTLLMLDYALNVQDTWASHPSTYLADISFMVVFVSLNLYLGVFSQLEAKRDALNLTNQAKLLENQRLMAMTNAELERLSFQDPLTELYNRRGFEKYSYPRPLDLAILMIDIDDFKLYNDFFGHPAGDQCIYTVAQILKRFDTPNALIARYGGEEFIMALRGYNEAQSLEIAERIRTVIQQAAISHPCARAAQVVTVSIGIACSHQASESLTPVIKRSDMALYAAKQAGRNCTRLFQAGITETYVAPAPVN